MAQKKDIKFLQSVDIGKDKKKYDRFDRYGINYIDYKDPDFLKGFLNEQGKILPRRLTGNTLKNQRRVAKAIKRARKIALIPYTTDLLK